METLTGGIQLVSVAGMVVMLALAGLVARRWPDARGLVIPPAMWSGYGLVYYALVLFDRLTGEALLLWGAVHRMLGVYMVLGGMIALWAVLAAPMPPDDEEGDGPE